MMEDTKDKSTATPSSKQPSNKPINPENVWIQGINLSISTPAEITQFVRWKIGIYKEFGWKWDNLGELYEMDFDQFRAEDFERCEHNTQVLLRNVLRSQGLYVKKGCGIKIARELAYAIHNKTKWPDDDPEKPISSPSRTKTPIRQDPLYNQARRLAAEQSRSRSQSQSQSRSRQPPEDQVIDALARVERSGHSRELMAIAKSYANDNYKYSGEATDSFNYKFTIFVNHCKRAKVSPDALLKAFPIMLTGIALEFYYINCRGKYHTINDLFAVFKNYFEEDEHKRNSSANGMALTYVLPFKRNQTSLSQRHFELWFSNSSKSSMASVVKCAQITCSGRKSSLLAKITLPVMLHVSGQAYHFQVSSMTFMPLFPVTRRQSGLNQIHPPSLTDDTMGHLQTMRGTDQIIPPWIIDKLKDTLNNTFTPIPNNLLKAMKKLTEGQRNALFAEKKIIGLPSTLKRNATSLRNGFRNESTNILPIKRRTTMMTIVTMNYQMGTLRRCS